MKNKFYFTCVLTLAVFLGGQAQAGLLGNSFFIEPYLALNTENSKLTDLSNNTIEIKTSSPSFGLIIGYRSMVGVDLNFFSDVTKGKAEITGLTEKNDYTKTSTGLQLGVNSLGLVKMYIGATLANDFKVEESSQAAETILSGPSYHVGLVLKSLRYLNIGLQYNLNQYNKVKGASYTLGDSTELYYSKIDTQNYLLYISSTF